MKTKSKGKNTSDRQNRVAGNPGPVAPRLALNKDGRMAPKVDNGKWEEVVFETVDCDGLGQDYPVNRLPVYARPGMIAFVPNFQHGRIEIVTEHHAIVSFRDGNMLPFRWGEVSLQDVQPDPSCYGRQTEPTRLERIEAAVRELMSERHGAKTLAKFPLVYVAVQKDGAARGDSLCIDVTEEINAARAKGGKR